MKRILRSGTTLYMSEWSLSCVVPLCEGVCISVSLFGLEAVWSWEEAGWFCCEWFIGNGALVIVCWLGVFFV